MFAYIMQENNNHCNPFNTITITIGMVVVQHYPFPIIVTTNKYSELEKKTNKTISLNYTFKN